MDDITLDASPTKLRLKFSSWDTIDLEMKEFGRKQILSREFTNSHFPPAFSCASNFLASTESFACRITAPIPSFYQYILIYILRYCSGISNVCPATMSSFNLYSNILSSVIYMFCIQFFPLYELNIRP